MSNWRIGSLNGALLAAYFVPVWGMIAYGIMFAPVHALYDQPNISAALYVSDHLHVAGMNLVRIAWLLALARFAVIAFFAVFLALLCWPSTRKSGACDEALGIALVVGSLLMLGTAIVLVFYQPAQKPAATSDAALRELQLANNG
jgi:hypothetical protein